MVTEMSAPTADGITGLVRSELGDVVNPEDVLVDLRNWRWVAQIPGGKIAFVAKGKEGMVRLRRERLVMALLAERVSFAVPEILYFSADDKFQIRAMIPGRQLGPDVNLEAFANSAVGARFASDYGRVFAELHLAISEDEAASIGLPAFAEFPQASSLRSRLLETMSHMDSELEVERLIQAYETLHVSATEFALIHGDPWGGNFAIDDETGALTGLFDFEDMAFDDRILDLRYVYSYGDNFADRVFEAYKNAIGLQPSANRCKIYHLLSAFKALAQAIEGGDGEMIDRRRRWVAHACETLLPGLSGGD